MVSAVPVQLHERAPYSCRVGSLRDESAKVSDPLFRRTLPVFLRSAIEQQTLLQNRRVALEFLRKLADRDQLGLQETCVLAWAQVGR